ncbi:MAG: ABC transporter permease, partial [Acidobacteria bacterium]|nr:ABC transporter permease [Acidobacteriota bacterium]
MIALQVARRDLLEMSRDGRLRWAVGVLLLLVAVSVWVGWTRSTQAASLRRAAADVQHEAWLEKGAMHPHMAAHYGMFLFKPVPA